MKFLHFLLGVSLVASPALHAAERPNILIILADDLGTTDLGVYRKATDPPKTPTIDRLARRGLVFSRAWSNPACSPTRACIQTGRHAFRTGVGFLPTPVGPALPTSEWVIPEALDAATGGTYSHAFFGKWHIGNNSVGGNMAPNSAGYSHFSGNLKSLIDTGASYFHWTKVTDGSIGHASVYNTTDIANDAIQWMGTASEPWVCVVAFNSPHTPLHAPPPELHTEDLSNSLPPTIEPRPYFRAMVQAMDTEIGRVLNSLGAVRGRTNIVFLGDNGSPAEVALPPIQPHQAKVSLYEPGIHIPLIITGPAVTKPGSSCSGLVHVVDLFSTVLELTGSSSGTGTGTIDSVSLVPYLSNPTQPSLRDHLYSEIFSPNGAGPYLFHGQAIRNHRYKLIKSSAGFGSVYSDALYDLRQDPLEVNNLLTTPLVHPDVLEIYFQLSSEIQNITSS